MGFVIKKPVSENQTRSQAQAELFTNAINAEVAARENAVSTLATNLNTEKAARESADSTLTTNLNNEKTVRENAVSDLQDKIDAETTARKAADSTLTTNLNNEKTARENADSDLQDKIDAETTARKAAVSTLTTNLNNEKTARESADSDLQDKIDAETTARKAADSTLTTNLNTEKAARESAVSDLQDKIDAETTARKAADSTLTTNLNSEKTARESAVSDLQDKIDAETTARKAADSTLTTNLNSEKTTRANADTNLQNQITALKNSVDSLGDFDTSGIDDKITAETTARKAADTTLQNAITAEETARKNADTSLQSTLTTKISNAVATEETARKAAVSALETNLTAKITDAVGDEETARKAADSTLQSNLTAAVNTEAQNRTAAITALETSLKSYTDGQISAVNASLIDFSASTATAAGKRGLVPAPPKGGETLILTSNGWVAPDDILETPTPVLTVSTVPTQSGTVTFSGSAQSPSWANFDSTKLKISGNTSGTNAGSYSVSFTPINGYVWADSLDQAAKSATWTITALKLAKPSASTTAFSYDGSAKSLDIKNFNSTYESQTGTVSATAAGTYTVTYSLKNTTNTKWSDGTTANVVINWSISSLGIAKPTASTTAFTYSGSAQSLAVNNYDADLMTQTGTITATNVGSYTATFALKDKTNNTWTDGTTADVKISWSIAALKLAKPAAASTNFTFNGSAKSLSISNYNSSYESQTGTTSATNAGSYSVTYKLKNKTNTKWADNSTDDVVISWTIEPQKITKPSAKTTAFKYDGSAKSLTISNYNSTYMTQSGTTSATDAGDYAVTYSLKSSNYAWSDGTAADVVISWSISSAGFYKPTAASTTFTFNGAAQSLTVSNYNADYMTQTGDVSATNAGTYSVTYSLKDKTSTTWTDGTTDDVVISWTIEKLLLDKPTAETVSFRYDGTEKTLAIENFDSNYMSQIGTTSATNAGDYIAHYDLKNKANTTWADGTNGTIRIYWKISKVRVINPTASTTTFTFNGAAQSLTVSNYNADYMTQTGDISATNAGTYSVTFSLKDKDNFVWHSSSKTDDVVISWTIEKLLLDKPTAANKTLTYTGSEQTLTVNNYDSNYMSQDGTVSATNVSSHAVTYSLKDKTNTTWSDGTTSNVVMIWSIDRIKLKKPTASPLTFTFNGKIQGPTLSDFNSDYEYTANRVGISAGDYALKIALSNTGITCWEDGTTDNVVINWKIEPLKIDKPTATTTTFTYTGAAQSLTVNNYNADYMTQTGDISATDAGDYSATYSLNSPSLIWKDGTSADVVINWNIEGISPNLTLASSTVTASISTTVATYSAIYERGGNISYPTVETLDYTSNSTGLIWLSSSNINVVYVSPNYKDAGRRVTFYPVARGTATITVRQSASGNYKGESKTFTVTVKSSRYVYLSCAQISALAKAGTLTNYMHIGDRTFRFKLSGTVGTLSVDDYYEMRLVDYRNNVATFEMVGAFKDSYYNSVSSDKKAFTFNYLNARFTEIYNLFPEALQNIITNVKRYYCTGGGIASGTFSKVFAPATFELLGVNPPVLETEKNQYQLEFYANGNGLSTTLNFWTCDDVYTDNTYKGVYIDTNPTPQIAADNSTSYALKPFFCVS